MVPRYKEKGRRYGGEEGDSVEAERRKIRGRQKNRVKRFHIAMC